MLGESRGVSESQPTQAKGPLDKQGPILGQLGNAPPVSLGALPQALTWCRDPKSTSALQWGAPQDRTVVGSKRFGDLAWKQRTELNQKGPEVGATLRLVFSPSLPHQGVPPLPPE